MADLLAMWLTGTVLAASIWTGPAWAANPANPAAPTDGRVSSPQTPSASPAATAISDLGKKSTGTLLELTTSALAPGRYRLHVPMALAPVGHLMVADVRIRLEVGGTSRTAGAIDFAASDEYVDLPVDFEVAKSGPQAVRVTWAFEGKQAEENRSKAAVRGGPSGGLDHGKAADDISLEGEAGGGAVSSEDARKTEFRLLARPPRVEPLAPVQVARVHTDKAVYKPGDKGAVAVTLRNAGPEAAKVELAIGMVTGLERSRPLHQQTVEIAAGKTLALDVPFDTTGLRWGGEVIATAKPLGGPTDLAPAVARGVFAVTDNIFECALLAAYPGRPTDYDDMAKARHAADELRAKGFTGFEAFFWAPCDMLDLNPKTKVFFGGQGAYPATITGTRNLNAALHEQGLAATVYANLWGGSGPPAFEIQRRHPEWFGDASYKNWVLEAWDLLGYAERMNGGKVRAPGIDWCYNQIDLNPPPELFACHARQLIETHKTFGWDGVRYDSFYTRYWAVGAIKQIRETVAKEVPDFRFGYNTFPRTDYRNLALETLCSGGQMVMAEGVRLERSANLAAYARELGSWRDLVWPYGAHLGPLHHASRESGKNKTQEPLTPLDLIHVCNVLMATGSHPYYGAMETPLGNFPQFATRYSEFIYDTRMRPLEHPERVISVGGGGQFFLWPSFARTVTVAPGKQRVVMHLLNIAADYVPWADRGMKPQPVRQDVPVTIALPVGAKPTAAWSLQAAPTVSHTVLALRADGNAVTVRIPEIRFAATLVLEFDSDTPLPTPPTAKDKTDSYIKQWKVIGPFPGDLELSEFDKPYPPEQKVDLAAEYDGLAGKVHWIDPVPAGQTPAVAGVVDFCQAFRFGTGPACGYATTTIVSDKPRDVYLFAKSDDTLTVWVNGTKVHARNGEREFGAYDEDKIKVHLDAGENRVLVKVCEKWLYWLLALRVAEEDGTPARGIRYVAK